MMPTTPTVLDVARRSHTPERISRTLCRADRMLAQGAAVIDVTRQLEASERTYRWLMAHSAHRAG